MAQPVGIVIPLYKERPDTLEHCSLERCAKVLKHYPTVLLVPEHLDVSFYRGIFTDIDVLRLPDSCFKGLESYNRLLLSPGFYERFSGEYEKICIVQPDVFLCYDALEEFCRLPYDYFGAPLGLFRHDRYELYGGNGGITLRNVGACIRILQSREVAESDWKPLEEDEFFSYCGEAFPEKFRVAPLHIAIKFAFDRFPRLLLHLNGGKLPMAIHSWYTHDAYFCRKLLAAELPENLAFGQENADELALEEFHAFMQAYPSVVFYGAGDFGKSFLQYVQMAGFDIDRFLISDGQPREEASYRRKSIVYFSEWQGNKSEIGVVVVMSRLIREQIAERLRQEGFQNVFVISETLCNAVLEQLLTNRFHEAGRLEEIERGKRLSSRLKVLAKRPI